MKKTKLLTSLAALALVLGLGACTTTEDETPTESGSSTTSEETSEPTDSTPSTPTVENYTLSFTFTLEEEEETLPDYETLYIAGSFNEWGFDELTENEGAYEITIPSIAVGTYEYKVLLAYNGAPDWENEIIPANEDKSNATFTVAEGDTGYALEWELTQAFEDYLEEITTRTDCTVYFHFTDEEHTETYSIPSYADGYVTGYFTTGVWTDYVIGSTGKLTAEEDGTYSYTFSQIATGTITYNIYFEYNSSAVNHEAATGASWNASRSIGGSGNTTMVIPATGDVHIDIDVNPADLISDEASTASCTIAVNDTASTVKTLYCSGTMNSWNNSNAMTYNASGTDYQYSYTFDCSENQELTFGIFNDSNWNDSLQIGTDATGLCSNSGNNVVVSGNAIGSNTNTLIIFTVDGTGFGGTSHVTTTAVTITH